MDEITFEDMLIHYLGKTQEAVDELQELKYSLKEVLSALESSWSGNAASACEQKLEEINSYLHKSEISLSDAQQYLANIKVLLPYEA